VDGGLLHLTNGVFLGNTSAYYTVPLNSTNAGAHLLFGPVDPLPVNTHDQTEGSIALKIVLVCFAADILHLGDCARWT
jgi:hypothetical protein